MICKCGQRLEKDWKVCPMCSRHLETGENLLSLIKDFAVCEIYADQKPLQCAFCTLESANFSQKERFIHGGDCPVRLLGLVPTEDLEVNNG